MSSSRRKQFLEETRESDTEGSWAISYGDMITLLLAFFVLFFFAESHKGTNPKETREIFTSLFTVLQSEETFVKAAPKKKVTQPSKDQKTELFNQINASLGFDLPEELEKYKAQVHNKTDFLIVEFPNVSFFHSGGLDLTPEGEEILKRFSKRFVPYAGRFLIAIRAFTDPQPVKFVPSRRFHDNLELSALRSIAAMRIMQTNGLPLNRMRLSGYGEHEETLQEMSTSKDLAEAEQLRFRLARKIVLVIYPEELKHEAS